MSRTSIRPGRVGHLAGRFLLRAGSVALVLLHVRILGRRVADASLLEPAVAAKWLAAIALCAGFLGLRRRARTMLSRRAGVLWLVALLLHVPLPAPAALTATGPVDALGAQWLLALPAGLSLGAAILLVGLALASATPGVAPPVARRAPALRSPRRPWRTVVTVGARAPPAVV